LKIRQFDNLAMRRKENWKMEDWRPDCYRRCALLLAPGALRFALCALP
jgi:hypothetical protein